jgi:peptidoglycan/xylan/chitin deacetylase (PgdA/CDA1 family)
MDDTKVAITFDDGPDKETTPALLEILEKHKIRAAFFCIGSKITGNEQIIKDVIEKGHIVGNHSWSHAFLFDFYLPGRMIEEIQKTDALIENVTNTQVKYFRPPFGVTNPFLSRAIKKTGHTVIGWSLKTFDTSSSRQKILNRIKSKLKNGDIILIHDANPKTLHLLEEAIHMIKEKGFKIIGLEELIMRNS